MKTIGGYFVEKNEINKVTKEIALRVLPEEISNILASRVVLKNDTELKQFLEPKIKTSLQDPFGYKDMQKACDCILGAIDGGDKICILGDYDVDGATSTALLVSYFRELGIDVETYIPDRLGEGYGVSEKAVLGLAENGVKTLITVDCGTVAFEPLKLAKEAGIKVVILDHHQSDSVFPECEALVNPNRFDEDVEFKSICACVVCFLFCVGMNSRLKQEGRQAPDLMSLLPLVALGTVCDVMPLLGVNRAFVDAGLKILNKNLNAKVNASQSGIVKLFKKAGGGDTIDVFHLGFLVGPMINAAGRIGDSSLGAKLLYSIDENEQNVIVDRLYDLNQERKSIERKISDSLKRNTDFETETEKNGFFLAFDNWHEGVIGIIASRMKDFYYRPAFVGAVNGDRVKLSTRSISDIDIGAVILKGKSEGVILEGGGHKSAGGFSVSMDGVGKLVEFLKKEIKSQSDAEHNNRVIYYDAEISVACATVDFAKTLSKLEPYGMANERPTFLVSKARVIRVQVLKDKHIRLLVSDQGKSQLAVCFNCIGTELGTALLSSEGKKISFLATIKAGFFNMEEKVDIIISDLIAD